MRRVFCGWEKGGGHWRGLPTICHRTIEKTKCVQSAFALLLLPQTSAARFPQQVKIDTFDSAAKFIQRLADENPELASILQDPVKLIKWSLPARRSNHPAGTPVIRPIRRP